MKKRTERIYLLLAVAGIIGALFLITIIVLLIQHERRFTYPEIYVKEAKISTSEVELDISIERPFEPIPGNVIFLSHYFWNTLIFTDCSIWKMANAIDYFSEPVRAMDTVDNIEMVIENTHVITSDKTLYYLDFENGEMVKQLENLVSIYRNHIGTAANPLQYARTADGTSWRVDTAQPEKLPDDYNVRNIAPQGSYGFNALKNLRFDEIRKMFQYSFILTEDNILWRSGYSGNGTRLEKIKEDVLTFTPFTPSFIVTLDNVLWRFPSSGEEAGFTKVMENVRAVEGRFFITTDNELWGFWSPEATRPFKIMEDVYSIQIQSFLGFVTMDDTLWWLSGWGREGAEYQRLIQVKENVSHTWWNWGHSEYIITTDRSLWLINYEYNYLVQIFQGGFLYEDE